MAHPLRTAVAWLLLPGTLGGFLLTHDIPAALQQADRSAGAIASALGIRDPWPHMASYVWGHPIAAILAFLLIVSVGPLLLARLETRAGRPKAATYVSPKEAIRYLADETVWGWNIRKKRTPGIIQGTPVSMRTNARLAALSEFQDQASREGTALKVYGTQFGSAQAQAISYIFWMTNGLSGTRLFSEAECETEPTIWAQSPDKFGDLKVDQAGLFATWPRLGPLKRWLLRREMRREQEEWANGK